MRREIILYVLSVLLVFVLLGALLGLDMLQERRMMNTPNVFVGVDVGYGDETTVYNIASAISGYANLIIIGSLKVTTNTTALTRVCDYLFQRGFYFIIYVGFATYQLLPPRGPDRQFFKETASRWGDKLLGVYLFDEVGGYQLDGTPYSKVVPASTLPDRFIETRDYTLAGETYSSRLTGFLSITKKWWDPPYPRLFTSDYALYWYDYLAGYQTVFTQFVGNQSRQLAIAMCRGAAHTLQSGFAYSHGIDWGVMITWKYRQSPFLESGSELYADMVLAYENQAKYIIVFNSPENNTAPTPLGTLASEHLDAMKRFWNYAKTNPFIGTYPAEIAYVLPRDYGYGFRSQRDTLWGIWDTDNLSSRIWNDTNRLLETYGSKIDFIYETAYGPQTISLPYNELIFWNGTFVKNSHNTKGTKDAPYSARRVFI
jgi:hypothetical protein